MAANDQIQRTDGGGDGDFRPVPVPQNQVVEVSKRSGIPVEQVGEFVVLYAGRPYITKAGLQFKTDLRYGIGEYYVLTDFPTQDEYTMAVRMMGWPATEPLIIMISRFYLSTRPDRPIFQNVGTASKKNCSTIKGVSNFDKRGIEIATTRSQNRVLRQATACGFAPLDEVWDGDDVQVQTEPEKPAKGGDPYGGFLKRCAALKDALKKSGKEAEYYNVLRSYGLRHANEIQPGDIERQFDILGALREAGATPKAERQAVDALYSEETKLPIADTNPTPEQAQDATATPIGNDGENALYKWADMSGVKRQHLFGSAVKNCGVKSLRDLTGAQVDWLKGHLIPPKPPTDPQEPTTTPDPAPAPTPTTDEPQGQPPDDQPAHEMTPEPQAEPSLSQEPDQATIDHRAEVAAASWEAQRDLGADPAETFGTLIPHSMLADERSALEKTFKMARSGDMKWRMVTATAGKLNALIYGDEK